MVNTNKLLGIMAEKGITQQDLAIHLGITPKTFYNKMKRKEFNTTEMKGITDYLCITDPVPIFFADEVTQ